MVTRRGESANFSLKTSLAVPVMLVSGRPPKSSIAAAPKMAKSGAPRMASAIRRATQIPSIAQPSPSMSSMERLVVNDTVAAIARIKNRTAMKMNIAGTMSCKATSGVDIWAPNTSSADLSPQKTSGLESPVIDQELDRRLADVNHVVGRPEHRVLERNLPGVVENR